jgi:membrane fusion protein (multidrug efflux system)
MTTRRELGAILLALTFAAGCGKKEEAAPAVETFPVRVEAATKRTLEDALILVGSLKAKDEATVFSRVPGKLKANLVKEGDRVRRGQPVALVERDEVGVRFEPAPVPSTLNGVVGRVYLDRGADVTPNTPVALIADVSAVIAKADVPERYAGRVRNGQDVRVRVEAFPERTFQGRVSRVSPVVDPATRSAYMEVLLDNSSGLLRSGMFANLSIVVTAKAGALAVPIEAVTDGSGPSIFVIKDGKAVKREVVEGLKTETHVEIKEGLSPGEEVVTFGLFGLKDGSAVQVLAPEPGEKK